MNFSRVLSRSRTLSKLLFSLVSVVSAVGARADRIVLAPNGDTLAPQSLKAEFALGAAKINENFAWVQYATHQGIEFEAQRYGAFLGLPSRFSFNVQYPIMYDFGRVPALSIGMRDVFRTGSEHRALYLALSKTVPLSDRQTRLVRELKYNIGAGTERLNGAFAGFHLELRSGMHLYAEYYQNRPNLSLAIPFARNLQARAYSLNGRPFYGLSYLSTH